MFKSGDKKEHDVNASVMEQKQEQSSNERRNSHASSFQDANQSSNSIRSLSTLENGSRAACSVFTCDETVVRRGDGAQVIFGSNKVNSQNFLEVDPSKDIGYDESNDTDNDERWWICWCCCRRRKMLI